MIGIWTSQTNERRIGISTETMNELGTEETTMVTVNVNVIEIVIGRKIGMWTENVKVTGIVTVIATEIVTEEIATVVSGELVREIEEVVIGIVEAVIGNETGRESTSDGLVHGKESGREIADC